MGEIEGVVRVWGATAAELLSACAAGADVVSIDPYLVLTTAGRSRTVHSLRTRTDGVVELVADGGAPSFVAPSWIVFQSTSCSKGIHYEAVRLWRGDEVLLSVVEDPDGNLEVRRAGTVVESIPQAWTAEGEPIPREKPTSFGDLVDKWLSVIAAELGEGAAVLQPGGDLQTYPEEGAVEGSDDLPF